MDVADNRPVAVGVADKHPAVLAYAMAEAHRSSCSLRLVHAYVVPPSAMSSVYGLDVPGSFRAGGQEVLNEAVHYLHRQAPVVAVETVLRRGFAKEVLELEAQQARLMVIGADESKPWPLRIVEGRVAHHLVEHAACPVVVVPQSWTAAQDAGAVVVMVDGESTAHGPLAYACASASARDVELQVVHVDPGSGAHPSTDVLAIRRVVDVWFARYPQVRGGLHVVHGDVPAAALEAARGVGLLVLGRPHERRLINRAMDSLAQDMIAAAGCPVAVVPSGYR